jgi:hypothetical protein
VPHHFDAETPWYSPFKQQQFSLAIEKGLEQLNLVRTTQPTKYETPKETPFYFMGIAAFASHDYQTATFFFDAAVAEDVRHSPNDNNTPALLFMRLDKTKQKQAATQIVDILADRLNIALEDYAARKGCRTLTFEDVRERFLDHLQRPHLRTLTATFISFLAEWQYRLQMIDLTGDVSREPFFTHLFRGCLLFESLLKEKVPKPYKKKTLAPLLNDNHYLRKALSISKIGKPIKTRSPGLQAILRQLKPNQKLRTAIQCTAQTRNTLGHNLVWAAPSLNRRNYDLLALNIVTACLHAIACLYLPRKP